MSNQAYVRSTSSETAIKQLGREINFLVEHDDSAGHLAVMQYVSMPGHEPPPHTHAHEDEAYYLLEGEFDVYYEDSVMTAKAGDCVFLPRGKAHAWLIRSPVLKTLIITQPANTDRLLRAYAALENSFASTKGTYNTALASDLGSRMIALATEYGLHVLSPEEIREQLPKFPVPRQT